MRRVKHVAIDNNTAKIKITVAVEGKTLGREETDHLVNCAISDCMGVLQRVPFAQSKLSEMKLS